MFKIKKGYLVGLASWLSEQVLSAKQNRERNRFVQVLVAEINITDKERIDIAERYAEKEEDGSAKKIKTVDKSTGKEAENYVMADTEEVLANAEVNDLYNEEFSLDVTEAIRERMAVIKDIVLNTDYKFGPKDSDSLEEKIAKIRQAGDYEFWCEAVESMGL